MKNIITSLGVIALASSVLFVGATGAFFSDQEVSTANVFTAGSINLKLNSSGAKYNGIMVSASNWFNGDPYAKFFDIATVTPGDRGARHLGFYNDSLTSAYVCLMSKETSASVSLGQEITAFVWNDRNNDLVYSPNAPASESPLTPSPVPIKDLSRVVYGDSTNGVTLGSGMENDISVAWCAGTMTVDHATGAISCDGAGMTTQGGTYKADMTVYAEQTKNNPNFKCADVVLP